MAQDAAQVSLINKQPSTSNPGGDPMYFITHGVRMAKSSSVAYNDTTSVVLFNVPADTLIVGAYIFVTTAFDASGDSAAPATATITVPNDTGGTDTIWDSATALLQATGVYPATAMAYVSASGNVILAYTAGTTTAGALTVYLEYVPNVSDL